MMACEPHWVRISDTLVIDTNRIVMARLIMPPEKPSEYATKYPYYQIWLDGRKDYICLNEEETKLMTRMLCMMAERVHAEDEDG